MSYFNLFLIVLVSFVLGLVSGKKVSSIPPKEKSSAPMFYVGGGGAGGMKHYKGHGGNEK